MLFQKIHVAQSVVDECAEGGRILLPSLTALDWIIIVPDTTSIHPPLLFDLDRGEKYTIALAKEYAASTVIIDEKIGRRVAEYLGLSVTGTLGILLKAKQLGYIPSFLDAAANMRKHGIYFNPSLIHKLARHIGEAS